MVRFASVSNPNVLELQLDADAVWQTVDRRLRARAARADSAVALTPETIERWAREELEAVVGEHAYAHLLAHRGMLN